MIDVVVTDGGLGKGAALRAALFVLGQSANAVTDEAAVERAAGELRDRLAQAAQHVVERQERAAPELDDNGLLGLSQDGAPRLRRPHGPIDGGGASSPLVDRLRVQPIAGRKNRGRLFRRLELGSIWHSDGNYRFGGRPMQTRDYGVLQRAHAFWE